MKMWSLLVLLPGVAVARLAISSARAEQRSAASPIEKVTTLLRDMQKQLEKEADDDEAVHDKMACWCETNNKEKNESAEEKRQRIADLQTTIETTSAASARLTSELENHKKDLAKSKQSLDTATALRQKQADEFHAEEKDMVQSIKALEAAIIVMSRHHATEFLDRTTAQAISKAIAVAREQIHKHKALLQGSITPRQRRMVLAFQQQAPGSPSKASNYQPQSGEIFGILRQMKETFENNLAESRKEDVANQKAYEGLKAAKLDEINAVESAIQQKTVQLAETDEKHAQAKQDLEDTNTMLVQDSGFLITVKEKCEKSEEEYQTRTKLRQEEITAVVQAIAILTSDQARDTFKKSYGSASLLQVRARREARREHQNHVSERRKKAASVLKAAAEKANSSELAALAVSSRLDPFTQVKAAIDRMVAELVQEKQEEIMHRDSCISEMNENQLLTEREERKKADYTSKKEGLEITVSDAKGNIKSLNAEIAELQVQIKRKGEDRELENRDFQNTVADHRETQKLLQKAITVFKAVYAQQTAAAQPQGAQLLQETQPIAPPPPEYASEYKRSAAGSGVVALLEQIHEDAVNMEKEVVKDEQESQEQYELLVKETNSAIASKTLAVADLDEDMQKAKQDLMVAKDDIQNTVVQLEQLSKTAGALHMGCDFILKNFDVRQDARDEEVEALRQAKAVLSGMQLD